MDRTQEAGRRASVVTKRRARGQPSQPEEWQEHTTGEETLVPPEHDNDDSGTEYP